ncbi:MAG TPA: RcnB family protein [Allosphingosinicella sp.]|nr:RcnB family protein [Allosphingosinicella sp.]
MRRALIGILMVATAATPLAAQDNGNRHDRGHQQEARPQRQAAPQRQAPQGQRFQQAPQAQRFQQAPQAQRFQQGQRFQGRNWAGQRNFQQQAPAEAQQRGAWQGRGGAGWNGQSRFQGQANAQRNVAPQDRRAWQQRPGAGFQQQRFQGNRQAWRGDRRGGVRWDRGWRNNGRYDWQRYRYANRRIFHLGPYYAPYRNYYYSPLEIGFVLDSLFYNQDYWIDPAYYDLPPAPPGAEWVRYYNDVLLVDLDSGEVLDSIHNFFW